MENLSAVVVYVNDKKKRYFVDWEFGKRADLRTQEYTVFKRFSGANAQPNAMEYQTYLRKKGYTKGNLGIWKV